MNQFTVILALLMGLTGSLHCAGMCGPIMLILPFQHLTGIKKGVGILLYHFGRISIYALMGFVLFSFRAFFHPEWQQYISIALGTILLLAGLAAFFARYSVKLPWAQYVKNNLAKTVASPVISTFFITGLLNGLLPCGLVYMALSAAVTSSSALQAVLLMYAFGIGTLPMLIGVTLMKTRIRLSNHLLKKMVPFAMFFFGCVFVIRGMNLGIPYLSPQLIVTQTQVRANCCHKP